MSTKTYFVFEKNKIKSDCFNTPDVELKQQHSFRNNNTGKYKDKSLFSCYEYDDQNCFVPDFVGYYKENETEIISLPKYLGWYDNNSHDAIKAVKWLYSSVNDEKQHEHRLLLP